MTCFVVIGAGGLGCPALLGLVAGGAERIVIVDHDRVEASNLQRQVLFSLADLGRPKAEVACWSLRERVPAERALVLEPRVERLAADSLDAWLAALPSDALVLECSDDPQLKFAVHDACLAQGRPLVLGGVLGFRGQVMAVAPEGKHACFRCLFEAPPPRELTPSCASVGVLGAVAGVIGHAMAGRALALARGEPVAGALLVFDLLRTELRELAPPRRADCPACTPRAGNLASRSA